MMFDENGTRISPADIQKSEQIYPRSSLNKQSSGRCKGICKKYKAKRPLLKSRYSAGQVRCQICEIYLTADGVDSSSGPEFCRCCNCRVRTKPRNSFLKEQYHEQMSRNVNEPGIEHESNKEKQEEFTPEKRSAPVYDEIKKSSKTYYELKEFIENEIRPQANYQYVMLNHLISHDDAHKGKIAEDLAFYNNKDPSNIDEVKYFLTVPVFGVLEKSGFIIKSFQPLLPGSHKRNIIKYHLDVDLKEFQLMEIDSLLDKKIIEWNKEHGISNFESKYEFDDIEWYENKQLLEEKISEEENIQDKQEGIPIEKTINYWLWSVNKDNWPQVKDENIWGSKATHEQIQSIVKPDDFIIFYVTGTKQIKGIFEVVDEWKDDSQNLTWVSEQISKEVIYKSKVNLRTLVLGTAFLDDLGNLSIFAGKNDASKYQTLMVTGPGYPANNNTSIPKSDFELIKKQLAESSATIELQKLREEKPDTESVEVLEKKSDSQLILKECPRCGLIIEGPLSEKELVQEIEESFGFRQMDPEESLHKKPQSYCRRCRTAKGTKIEHEEPKPKLMNVFELEQDGISIKRFEIKSSEFIQKGQNLTNDEIVAKFRVGNMGGIRYSAKNNLIVLFDTESGHYKDEIDKEFQIIYYTGEGQTGDQTLTGGNQRIVDSENTSMFYFLEVPQEPGQNKRGALGKIYRFVGKVRYLKHATKTENDIDGSPREVIKFLLEVEK